MYIYEGNGPVASVPSQMRRCNTSVVFNAQRVGTCTDPRQSWGAGLVSADLTFCTSHTPHKWAVGTTFEWEFDFPMTTNPAYQPKPKSKAVKRGKAGGGTEW